MTTTAPCAGAGTPFAFRCPTPTVPRIAETVGELRIERPAHPLVEGLAYVGVVIQRA